MRTKYSKLIMAIVAMSFIILSGCGADQDGGDIEQHSVLESTQSDNLVKEDVESESDDREDEEDSPNTVNADGGSSDGREQDEVRKRTLRLVYFMEIEGEYAVTKDSDDVIYKVKVENLDRLKKGESYALEYALADAEEVEDNVYYIEDGLLAQPQPDDKW